MRYKAHTKMFKRMRLISSKYVIFIFVPRLDSGYASKPKGIGSSELTVKRGRKTV
jgi:hypothetical protein